VHQGTKPGAHAQPQRSTSPHRVRPTRRPGAGQSPQHSAAIRRLPTITCSTRVLSVQLLDRNARRVSRQARAAARHGRAVEWLAMVMYGLDRFRPSGARRVDARANLAHTAAIAAAVADFGTGRHAMPGLQDSAAQTGRAERTITRHWGTLATLGVLQLTDPGRWLTADERHQVYADPDQRDRWRNRNEFALLIPDWVREVSDEELAPWLARARAVLARVIAPDQADDHGASVPDTRSVYPPSGADLVLYLPVRRTKFSLTAASARRRRPDRRRPPNRPNGRAEVGAASRLSPTRKNTPGRGRALPPEAVSLAAQLATDARFPWLADSPRYMLAATVRRLADRWTADDIHAHVEATLRDRGWTMPPWVIAPVKYLALLLTGADAQLPPVTTARDAAVDERTRRLEQAAQRRRDRQQHRPVPGSSHPAVQQFRASRGWWPTPAAPAEVTPPTTPATVEPAPPAPRSSAAIHAAALARARAERRQARINAGRRLAPQPSPPPQ
jgi:hypothetical protein